MTNHDLALQLLGIAIQHDGLHMGEDFMSLDAVRVMVNEFITKVPIIEVRPDQPMTVMGVTPNEISIGYQLSMQAKMPHMIYDCDTCGFAPSTQDIPQFGANWRRCAKTQCRGTLRWRKA